MIIKFNPLIIKLTQGVKHAKTRKVCFHSRNKTNLSPFKPKDTNLAIIVIVKIVVKICYVDAFRNYFIQPLNFVK